MSTPSGDVVPITEDQGGALHVATVLYDAFFPWFDFGDELYADWVRTWGPLPTQTA